MLLYVIILFQLQPLVGLKEGDPLVRMNFEKTRELSEWEISGKVEWNDGLRMVATETPARVVYDHATALGEKTTVITFQISADNSVFGLGFNDFEKMGFGTVVMLNARLNQLSMANWNGDQNALEENPGLVKRIETDLEEDQWYTLKIEKQFGKNILTLLDSHSEVLITLECEQGEACKTGRQWGQPVIFCNSGSVLVHDFTMSVPTKSPDVLVLGDSNVEGPVILQEDYDSSWAYLLKEHSDLTIAIAGRGGDESTHVLTRLNVELDQLQPRKVLVAIGTNDNNHEIWRKNMKVLINRITEIGAEPVLCTLFPKPTQEEKTLACNRDIREGYFGHYKYIDLATAVSLDPQGEKWKSSCDSGDHVHASIIGMKSVLNYLKNEHKEYLKILE